MLRIDRLIEEISKVRSVIRPNSQDTVSQLQDYTISPPQIPDPSTAQAVVNSPAVQNGRAPDFGADDVIVSDCSSKQRYRHKSV